MKPGSVFALIALVAVTTISFAHALDFAKGEVLRKQDEFLRGVRVLGYIPEGNQCSYKTDVLQSVDDYGSVYCVDIGHMDMLLRRRGF